MSAAGVLAWIATLAFGSGVWAAADGLPRRGARWAAALGYGFVIGCCAAGLLIGLLQPASTRRVLPLVGSTLVVLALAAWTFAWWRNRRVMQPPLADVPLGRWRWLIALLLALLAVRGIYLLDEILLRPVFPWDAWWVWAARAKAWFLGGALDPVVDPQAWLSQRGEMLRTTLAYNYPLLLSRMELWFVCAVGEWNEPAINLTWFGLWLAMLGGCYGQWRLLGASRRTAAIAVYALGALPLLDVHVALAGYADLWLTAAFAFAVLSWMRWQEARERGQLALAIVLLVLLPLLKFEGVVWALCLVAMLVLGLVPAQLRWWGFGAAIVVTGLAIATSIALDLAWVRLAHDLLSGATGGRAAQSRFEVLRVVLDALFAQNNWNLFWYAAFGVIAWRWRTAWNAMPLRLLGGVFVLGIGFVAALFFLTPAAKWAESYTAVNRLMLQLVPLAATLTVLLLRDPPTRADTARAVPVSSAPA